jgi:hypothetical protein
LLGKTIFINKAIMNIAKETNTVTAEELFTGPSTKFVSNIISLFFYQNSTN